MIAPGFTPEHDLFRQNLRSYVEKELAPHALEWDEAGIFPREVFTGMAELGALGINYSEDVGGSGGDYWYVVVLAEELTRSRNAGVNMALLVQSQMATPIIGEIGTAEQKKEFLAPALAGEKIAALGISEPDAGSDVAGIRTRAVREGDEWVINGSKLYITNGTQADWLCLLARTSEETGFRGMSQIVVPTDRPGFTVSRKLDKLGNRSSDTAELSFNELRVPVANTIGEIGRGFHQQMAQFQNERMIAAYMSIGGMLVAVERTIEYVKARHAFGRPLADNQHIQFALAELVAEIDVARAYNHTCAEAYLRGEDTTRYATIAKLMTGRLNRKVADTCIQFHGGVGYMEETWTARFFRDSRLLSIGGGADEVMLRVLAQLDDIGRS